MLSIIQFLHIASKHFLTSRFKSITTINMLNNTILQTLGRVERNIPCKENQGEPKIPCKHSNILADFIHFDIITKASSMIVYSNNHENFKPVNQYLSSLLFIICSLKKVFILKYKSNTDPSLYLTNSVGVSQRGIIPSIFIERSVFNFSISH